MLKDRLLELRKEKKLSQEDLGKSLNVSGRTIGYYESDERSPTAEVLIQLGDFFNVSVDYLLGRTDIRLGIMEQEELFSGLPPEALEEVKSFLMFVRQKYGCKKK
jgi:transcriptional regulator with XRE-family HTH domain